MAISDQSPIGRLLSHSYPPPPSLSRPITPLITSFSALKVTVQLQVFCIHYDGDDSLTLNIYPFLAFSH